MDAVVDKEHMMAARKLLECYTIYEKEARDLINIGEYKPGRNPKMDYAVNKNEAITQFLRQGIYEKAEFKETIERLKSMFK